MLSYDFMQQHVHHCLVFTVILFYMMIVCLINAFILQDTNFCTVELCLCATNDTCAIMMDQ
jgi:hypothetical protein